jgi:hypothetical protein
MDDGQPKYPDLSPKVVEWENFELEVVSYLEAELRRNALGLDPRTSKVRHRPQYFSKSRESEITFDASIEWQPPEAESPGLIWLWECKSYPNRKVTIDELEEFDSKIQQVGAHKGTVVTRKGFQEGAKAFAKTRRIMLMTLVNREAVVLQFSRDQRMSTVRTIDTEYCLFSDGHEFVSNDRWRKHLESAVLQELSKIRLES